jgi:predicted RNA-binding protein with PUA-like domain
MAHWLMKSEPSVYSIDDLRRDGSTSWGGVRNYQVRNMFRDDFRPGDTAFFYHSGCDVPGIVGVMRVQGRAYPDPTQFDPRSGYHDPRSRLEDPAWLTVDVKFQRKFRRTVTLEELRGQVALADLLVLRRGSRLSVTPVDAGHWELILALARGGGS